MIRHDVQSRSGEHLNACCLFVSYIRSPQNTTIYHSTTLIMPTTPPPHTSWHTPTLICRRFPRCAGKLFTTRAPNPPQPAAPRTNGAQLRGQSQVMSDRERHKAGWLLYVAGHPIGERSSPTPNPALLAAGGHPNAKWNVMVTQPHFYSHLLRCTPSGCWLKPARHSTLF